ncbi:hypothetical protein [Bilophila wadsworthia]|uniref:hypothetical protein n=1 Tax=Bilophila wadsworthia TaxID=35833 RepID=UPI0035229F8B
MPSKRRMYHLLRLVTKAALWGAISRLASWLMGKILSYKDNAEKNSIGVVLQVATYNYINIYLLKYRFMVLRG